MYSNIYCTKKNMDVSEKPKLHISMFPWIAIGHIIPNIHLANELAGRGHSVSILIPTKAITQLADNNLHPHLITFHPLAVPQVPGLPAGAETASDIDSSARNPLAVAFDALRHQVEALLSSLKPDVVFFDFAHWIPDLASRIGFKTVFYNVICASSMAISIVPARKIPADRRLTAEELLTPPDGYPSTTVVLRGREEALTLSMITMDYGAIRFDARMTAAARNCDAIGIRTCRELEGPMADYVSSQYGKPVLLSGPVLPGLANGPLEEKWANWFNKFQPKSVVYCAFGSQVILKKAQFQELLLGFEMMGLPFFVALSKPDGVESIEEALPEGFLERVGERGVVHGGWVPQTHILAHPSVGCFVSHCGFGSMWESLLSESQIVLVPRLADQILNTRLLAEELKVAVEVERGDMGWFSKGDLCKAIKSVMDEESEVGKMGKLIRQASLSNSESFPPRKSRAANKGFAPSSGISRHGSITNYDLAKLKGPQKTRPQGPMSQLKTQRSMNDLELYKELQGFSGLGLLDPNEPRTPKSTEDVKAQIKFWARAVASNVRQES